VSASAATRRAPSRRGAVLVGLIAVGLLVTAVFVGRPPQDGEPLDPRSDGPLGTSALVELLRRLDATVELSVGLPGDTDDVALVLRDELTDAQRDDLLAWARDGGRVVVASPGPLTPDTVAGALLDLGVLDVEPGRCTISALAGIGVLEPGGGSRLEPPPGSDVCYADDAGAYVVARPEGAGVVVSIGGPGFAVNDRLDQADNAAFAAALLAPEPGTAVRFVDPPVPAGGGDRTLLELIPAGLGRALLQLGVAFVLYALWRAIRLGKPVVEHRPVRVAGSEIVGAVGRLLARTRAPGSAAELVRTDLRRNLGARLGLPPDASAEQFADAVTERTGADRATVLTAVSDAPVTTDDELVAVTRAAAAIRQEVLR
jgi:hypothetical protein